MATAQPEKVVKTLWQIEQDEERFQQIEDDNHKLMSRYDAYWRLPNFSKHLTRDLRAHLKHLGYSVPGNTSTFCCTEILQRRERGGLCYARCSTDELAMFIKRRKLQVGPFDPYAGPFKAVRDRTIEILEVADDDQTFERFPDLPTELRVRVYEHYVASFPETLVAPSQPPLAKTCTLLRKEVLPIFYSNITLDFAVRRKYYTVHEYRLKFTCEQAMMLELL